jgi:FtsX-like permease family
VKFGTLVRLSLASTKTDLLRVGLTAVATILATIAVLSAVTVMNISCTDMGERGVMASIGGQTIAPRCGDPRAGSAGWSQQYSANLLREPGLRPGVVFALLMLAIPVLALAAQASRIGAPARERRLATLRLAGATPRQTIYVAAGETGAAALVGTLLGAGVFLMLRWRLDHPDTEGRLALPTDVVLDPLWFVGIVLGIPLVAAGIAALTLRSVVVGPLGVVRRANAKRPTPWPALLIALGIGAFMLSSASVHQLHWGSAVETTLIAVGALCATIGTVLCVGWAGRTIGRLFERSGRPSVLIAGRRLVTDPWSGSRALGAMLAAAVFGGGAIAYRAHLQTQADLNAQADRAFSEMTGQAYVGHTDPFFLQTMDLVDVAVYLGAALAALALVVAFTERIAGRRRAYAALVATGVPRGAIARASVWQSLAPAVPAIALAVAVGATAMFAFAGSVTAGGWGSGVCPDPDQSVCFGPSGDPSRAIEIKVPTIAANPAIPWTAFGMFAASMLGLVLLTALLSLTVLRSSTDIAELRAP